MTQDSKVTSTPSMEDLLQACIPDQLERVAQLLERFPSEFRILRKLDPAELMLRPDQVPEDAGFALVADTETTGRNANTDLLIELGMVEIAYDRLTGYIYGVTRVFDELEDPGIPIPAEASAVNGISDEMVAGKRIDDAVVQAMVETADFVLCHNSSYDRPILERRFQFFKAKAFACSMVQVDWQKAEITGTKLEYIAYRMGFFYDAHRAETDCFALVKVLNTPLPGLDGGTPFQGLLDVYRNEDRKIWAAGAPYEAKGLLAERKYRWNDGTVPDTEKAWARAVSLEEFEVELEWLKREVWNGRSLSVPVDRIDAFNRFSSRRDKLDRAYR